MDEAAARRILLVRAFETTPGAPWSDADRRWADREAQREAGTAQADAEALIAGRARLASQRLVSRDPGIGTLLAAIDMPAWASTTLAAIAFAIGLASDAIGGSHRINLLAPPLLALMVWNLAVYALLAAHALRGRGAGSVRGPWRSALQALLDRMIALALPRQRSKAMVRFVADWSASGRALHGQRLARALHLAAAAFALGALASMYGRGLAFEYRAGWDSTFLDADAVRRILGIVLAPARAFAGLELPDAARLAALHFAGGAGENAARWIHAWAVSVLVVVVLPRLALAGLATWRAGQLAKAFALALEGDYFEPLLGRLASARPSATRVAVDPAAPPRTIALSLVSHTNVGKTTLARTLLRRDIGEVRDADHVTFAAEGHTLVESNAGDRLELWDTPGFGDSVRLAARLSQSSTPVGWFLGEVWDRVRDRAFWSSQHAVRNVFERSDVVLYLVDAHQAPIERSRFVDSQNARSLTPALSRRERVGTAELADANPGKVDTDLAMVDAELRVLELLRKPVVVLLNRLGPPKPADEQAAEVAVWRQRLAGRACVRDVLALDAFTRCWVDEGTLLDAVARMLAGDLQPAFARLVSAWHERSQAVWRESMQVLAQRLARAALDRETVAAGGWTGRLMDVGASLGLRQRGAAGEPATARERAMQRLAERLAADVRASTDDLIHLHELGGHATDEVLDSLAQHFAADEPLDEGRAALWGGIASGALIGLKADLASGGLTLGGGMLAGGIVGALGAAGLARGYNQVRGVETPTIAWSRDALDAQARAVLMAYLAVAHHGRGRGDWAVNERPRFWGDAVDAVLESHRASLHTAWALRDDAAAPSAPLDSELQRWVTRASGELLHTLYPASGALAARA